MVPEISQEKLRALFVVELTQEFCNANRSELGEIGAAIKEAFANLEKRFGTKVLGTLDDDLLQVGATRGSPVSYILVELPNLNAAFEITNLVRTPYRDGRLVKYITIDCRIGRPLFFGNE